LWIAWEAGPEKWANDSAEGGLRARRDIEIACFTDGKLHRDAEAEASLRKLGGESGLQAPTLAFGAGNRARLLFRQPIDTNWLAVGTTEWNDSGWTKPEMLPHSEGRIDQRIVTATAGTRILAAYPSGSAHNTISVRAFESGSLGDSALRLTAADPLPSKP